jgi:hypothetical protein
VNLYRRTLPIALAAVALLAACGNDTVDQAGPADLPVATPTSTPEPTTTSTPEPTTTPSATASSTPTATAIPGFVAGTDLPKHPTSDWFAGKVTAGMPEFGPFCVENALKTEKHLWHRQFGTEFDTNATQVVVRLDSEADAVAFVDMLSHGAALCAEDWLTGFPDGSAEGKDYGAPSASTHVYGVHTSVPESEDGAHLYGIGRDGTLVTVVSWGQMGSLKDAPVDAFEQTIQTAVEKLS